MDSELEQKVSDWKAAKADRDYATADRLRAELRDAGYDPDKPHLQPSQDPDILAKIEQWREAKESKDFITADLIRSELRAKGVEPDPRKGGDKGGGKGGGGGGRSDRNSGGGGGGRNSGGDGWGNNDPSFMPSWGAMPMAHMGMPASYMKPYDHSLEAELDQWEDARSSKDWVTADELRTGLRSRGVSPSKERPQNGNMQDDIMQWKRAKEARDFTRSDRIRDVLRSQGVDPASMSNFMPNPMHGQFIDSGMKRPMSVRKESPASFQSTSNMDQRSITDLNEWFDAKDLKNWGIADEIRDRLRSKGIEPANCQRPGAPGRDDPEVADMLSQWNEAREQKNFGIADSIRERLRARGVEPSQMPAPNSGGGGGYGRAGGGRGGSRSSPYSAATAGGHDYATECKLDEWWNAKQEKNFALSDTLRSELRAKGIEPEKFRPQR